MLTDLGNFSGRTRSAVSVREGQGVVLMCSPPPHSPGTVAPFSIAAALFHMCVCGPVDRALAGDTAIAIAMCMGSGLCLSPS